MSVYNFLCEFREDDTTIDGKFYDVPLSENQKRQLNEAIPATECYIEARRKIIDTHKI